MIGTRRESFTAHTSLADQVQVVRGSPHPIVVYLLRYLPVLHAMSLMINHKEGSVPEKAHKVLQVRSWPWMDTVTRPYQRR